MTVRKALLWATKILKSVKIDSAPLDARLLLSFCLKKSPEWLLSHDDCELSARQLQRFKKYITRRERHEPIAYIIGAKEFYGRKFFVSRACLVPRPETETLIYQTLESLKKNNGRAAILDIGTGSGCIAITLANELEKLNLRNVKIFAIDSSRAALKVAQENARQHIAKISFMHGSLLDVFFPAVPWSEPWNCKNLIFVANLPYLTPTEWRTSEPEIRKYEPRSALVGGKNGLKYYQKLLEQIQRLSLTNEFYISNKSGRAYITCLFEINPWQKKPLTQIIKKIFPRARVSWIKDFGGSMRVCEIKI